MKNKVRLLSDSNFLCHLPVAPQCLGIVGCELWLLSAAAVYPVKQGSPLFFSVTLETLKKDRKTNRVHFFFLTTFITATFKQEICLLCHNQQLWQQTDSPGSLVILAADAVRNLSIKDIQSLFLMCTLFCHLKDFLQLFYLNVNMHTSSELRQHPTGKTVSSDNLTNFSLVWNGEKQE